MGEISKVRLVHCPKCDTLLPEISDYQCGGCGAVLQATKNGDLEGVTGLERSYEENVGISFENLSGNLGNSSVGKGRGFGVENIEEGLVSDINYNVGDTAVEKFENGYKKYVSDRDFEVEIVDFGESELGNVNLRSDVNSSITRVDNVLGLRRTSGVFERNLCDVREQEEQFGTRQGYFDEMRSSSSNYKREIAREARSMEDVEPNREELLRKMEELKDQLRKVQNGNNKLHEKLPVEHMITPLETYVESEDYYRGHSSTFHQIPREYIAPPYKHVVSGAPYFNRYHEPFAPYHRPDNVTSHGYHDSHHVSNYVPSHHRYEDPLEPQMFRRPSQQVQGHPRYMCHEIDQFEPRPYVNTSIDHHYSCSCYRCYDPQQIVAPQVQTSAFSNRTFHHGPTKSDPYHHDRRGSLGSPSYNSRLMNTPPSGSNKPQSHTRWPSDHNIERNADARPQRAVLSKSHHYCPVASGAPFVTCRNCFQLLKLPKKVCTKMGMWQMTCGACSLVLSFAFVDEKLTSIDPSSKQTNPEIVDSVNEIDMGQGYLKRNNMSYCSEDYANAGFDFQAMDRDPSFTSTSRSLSSRKSEETHNIQSVSYATSEDEKSDDSSPPTRSPPQDSFDYTSKYRAVNKLETGSLSSCTSRSDAMTIRSTLGKLSLKESVATEMDLSPSAYGSARLSKGASEKFREDDEVKSKKGDSFFGGFLKKSFRSNQSVENTKKNVTVNGHLIPDKLVKKAEKLAGPVFSGNYWYDYRAGFWGVVGGPCLGIIPSSIEEFNYPMPEKCAAGTTRVFVNGRELHQKDLELLSTRGLPSSADKSYIVDISGRVVDEDTGEVHVNLGKLAPTIEKVKHGFGMKPPKAVA